jgi:DNA-binding CsgD family transcriptional regulator
MEPMLCPVLIGRAAELRSVVHALDKAGEGNGSVLFVTGDAGVGKSRLVREAIELASERGFLVLRGRAPDSAVPVPYRPVSEALMGAARAGLSPDWAGLAEYRAALGSLVPEWSRPGDDTAETSAVVLGEGLLRLLSRPASPGGLLILEDMQWADPETLAILEYLTDNSSAAKLLCLATLRDSELTPGLELLRSATARRAASRVELAHLGHRAVAQMAAACLHADGLPRGLGQLLADCDGLPFAVEEILAAAVHSGQLVHGSDGWEIDRNVVTGVPVSIAGSVHSRLAAMPERARSVIESAAILGRQFDWTLLPVVADVSESDALTALLRAREMQLIEPVTDEGDTFRFRHSLTRSAIVCGLLPPALATRSGRAAAAIEAAHPELPGGWCELVAELRTAAGEPDRAAELLLTAGRRAIRRCALTSAAGALQQAQKLVAAMDRPDGMLEIDIDEALAEAVALSGDSAQLHLLAAELVGRIEATGADQRRAARIQILAASTRPQDQPAAAAAYLSSAAGIARQLGDAELAGRVAAVGARHALVTGELDVAERLARQALAGAEAAGLTGWAADVAVEALDVIGSRARGRDLVAARTAFERGQQVAEHAELAVWRTRMLHRLGTIDMLAEGATGRLSEARRLAEEAGLRSTALLIDLQLANLWSLGVELDKVLAVAANCERGATRLSAHRIEVMAICLQALVHGIRRDAHAAEQAARRAEEILPGDPEVLFTTRGQVRVVAALFRDDIRRATASSSDALAYGREVLRAPHRARGYYSPAQAPLAARGRTWGIAALLQATSSGDARSVIQDATDAGAAIGWNRGWLSYAEAVLAGRAGDRARATKLADEGSRHFGRHAPWWDHLARRLAAPAALADGWGEPRNWLREAAAGFEDTGHDRLAAACRGLLRQAGERVPRAGRGLARVPLQLRRLGVTSREMDVYLLVARGLSNAEIADRLFISPKTVETHVASLVLKTGQAGRRELVAHAARSSGPR